MISQCLQIGRPPLPTSHLTSMSSLLCRAGTPFLSRKSVLLLAGKIPRISHCSARLWNFCPPKTLSCLCSYLAGFYPCHVHSEVSCPPFIKGLFSPALHTPVTLLPQLLALFSVWKALFVVITFKRLVFFFFNCCLCLSYDYNINSVRTPPCATSWWFILET